MGCPPCAATCSHFTRSKAFDYRISESRRSHSRNHRDDAAGRVPHRHGGHSTPNRCRPVLNPPASSFEILIATSFSCPAPITTNRCGLWERYSPNTSYQSRNSSIATGVTAQFVFWACETVEGLGADTAQAQSAHDRKCLMILGSRYPSRSARCPCAFCPAQKMRQPGRGKMKNILFFNRMLTPKVITVVYWFGLFAAATTGGKLMFGGWGGFTVSKFLIGIVAAASGAVAARISCELIMVLFKMNEALQEVRHRKEF